MPKKIAVVLCLLALCGMSCSELSCFDFTRSESGGDPYTDRTARAKLHLRMEGWNENGTFPVEVKGFDTTGVLKDWRFKYSTLYITFVGNKAHPVDSKYVMEAIANHWYRLYPEDRKPRFALEVRAFKDSEEAGNVWGICKIRKNGEIETQWYATQTM